MWICVIRHITRREWLGQIINYRGGQVLCAILLNQMSKVRRVKMSLRIMRIYYAGSAPTLITRDKAVTLSDSQTFLKELLQRVYKPRFILVIGYRDAVNLNRLVGTMEQCKNEAASLATPRHLKINQQCSAKSIVPFISSVNIFLTRW